MYPRLCGPRGPRFIIRGGVRGNPFRLFRVFRGLFIGGAGFGATSVSFRVFRDALSEVEAWLNSGGGG